MKTTKPASLSAEKLSDLPIELQSHILSHISGGLQTTPIEISLDGAEAVTQPGVALPLPDDLLSVAQTSNALSAATAHALGPRAAYLTNTVTKGQLALWVSALAPFVRAVIADTFYSEVEGHVEEVDTEQSTDSILSEQVAEPFSATEFTPNHQVSSPCELAVSDPTSGNSVSPFFDNTLQLFKSLSGDKVSLEVLDLASIRLQGCQAGEEEQILSGLVSALERSSASLKELSLPVNDLYAKALASVTLKSLNVLYLDAYNQMDKRFVRNEKGRMAEAVTQMLQALDGHADRSRKMNTLRELQLSNVNEAPCVDIAESGCSPGLFNAVTTLRLYVNELSRRGHDSMARFISLFPNLERLHWNGVVQPQHLHMINRACASMQEFHLCSHVVYHPPSMLDSDEDEEEPVTHGDASILGEIFAACDGKLRTLELHGKSVEQMRVLGEINPNLRHIEIELCQANVAGLVSLLGRHCRRIQKLNFTVFPDNEDGDLEEGLGEDGWRHFTEAICSASDELCEVTIELDDGIIATENRIEPVIQSMVEVLEFLGERARKVHFQACMDTDAADSEEVRNVLVNGLCRIIRTCYSQTKNLEYLDATFYGIDFFSNEINDQEKALYRKLLNEKKKLLEKMPFLRSWSLGGLDGEIEYRLDQMEV